MAEFEQPEVFGEIKQAAEDLTFDQINKLSEVFQHRLSQISRKEEPSYFESLFVDEVAKKGARYVEYWLAHPEVRLPSVGSPTARNFYFATARMVRNVSVMSELTEYHDWETIPDIDEVMEDKKSYMEFLRLMSSRPYLSSADMHYPLRAPMEDYALNVMKLITWLAEHNGTLPVRPILIRDIKSLLDLYELTGEEHQD